jgi:hypothetical protein
MAKKILSIDEAKQLVKGKKKAGKNQTGNKKYS